MRRVIACATFVVSAVAACGCSSRAVDFERMRQQRRADPYGSTSAFADGATMRRPPAGTVSYGAPTLAIASGRAGAAPVEDMPLQVTTELLATGRHQFQTFCAVCHGDDGAARTVMSANMPEKPPPSLLTREVRQHSPGELFQIVSGGKGRMPSYDWALPTATERWAVIAYLQQLRQDASGGMRDSGR